MVVLAGMMLFSRCHHPTPSAAAVEIAPGVTGEMTQTIAKELVAAFDRAELAVQQADLEALMLFYEKGYNYHGLKRSDVRRVWTEVFSHYGQITSKHLFTELKVVRAGTQTKAFVTCTGGLYGTDKESGKPVTTPIRSPSSSDSWFVTSTPFSSSTAFFFTLRPGNSTRTSASPSLTWSGADDRMSMSQPL